MQTMFDPIAKPSFDAEGKTRYLEWLEKRYRGDLGALNTRYGLNATSFTALEPPEYWLRPGEMTWWGCVLPTANDVEHRTADFYRWIDNQTWLSEVMVDHFATMKLHWRELEPSLFIEPILHQWGYFFNPPGHTHWQTGQRALDVYRIAPHVDSVLFITAPLDAENRADAMVVSVETSIMRCANEGRGFTAGLYLGRHINGDIYSVVSPAEALATQIAHGAKGFHIYGYSGLDDGGVLFRMDRGFKDSLRAGNRWAEKVIPRLDKPRVKEVALLFPAAMSLYEPLERDLEGRHRTDLLGWYTQFTDLGWHVDILHPLQIAAGALKHYTHLVVPHQSLYEFGENDGLETAVNTFVAEGGLLFHGPHCELARRVFGIEESVVDFDCIHWIEQIIPHGWSTVVFHGGKARGTYIQSGASAITQTDHGKGRVFSFGFQYGHAYSRRTMPIVPPRYGKREMHPLPLLTTTPMGVYAGVSPLAPISPVKGVEIARFGEGCIVVNHRSTPVGIQDIGARREMPLIPTAAGWLAGHSASYFEW